MDSYIKEQLRVVRSMVVAGTLLVTTLIGYLGYQISSEWEFWMVIAIVAAVGLIIVMIADLIKTRKFKKEHAEEVW